MTPSISVVVPIYDGEQTLPELLRRLAPVLAALARDYEVILVNDGSRDQTWAMIRQWSAQHGWIRGINLMRNYGQHNALLCGIRAARYDVIVTMDADLQNPPEEMGKMVSKLAEGFDVVFGTPAQQKHGFLRGAASLLTRLAMQSAAGGEAARIFSTYRAFRTPLRDAFSSYRGPFVCIDVLLSWATTRFASVKVQHEPRTTGQSAYTFRKLVRHALTMLTGFSVLPLQIASVLGFSFTLFGMAVLAFVVGRYFLQGTKLPGFPFLASTIAIFSGVQLFTLGIIGEYLARMHFRMMERPPYVVLESTQSELPAQKCP